MYKVGLLSNYVGEQDVLNQTSSDNKNQWINTWLISQKHLKIEFSE